MTKSLRDFAAAAVPVLVVCAILTAVGSYDLDAGGILLAICVSLGAGIGSAVYYRDDYS